MRAMTLDSTVPKAMAATPNLAGVASGNQVFSVKKWNPATRNAGIAFHTRKAAMATIKARMNRPDPRVRPRKMRSPRRTSRVWREARESEVGAAKAMNSGTGRSATSRSDGVHRRLVLRLQIGRQRRVVQALGCSLARPDRVRQ